MNDDAFNEADEPKDVSGLNLEFAEDDDESLEAEMAAEAIADDGDAPEALVAQDADHDADETADQAADQDA